MKKRVLTVALIFLIFIMSFSLVACNSTKHHEETLDINNYLKYIEFNTSLGNSITGYDYILHVKGALTYAYYEDIVVTVQVEERGEYVNITIPLNAAGNGSKKIASQVTPYKIINVKGKIIYNI